MILGRFEHPSSACFDEIDFAVRQMTDRTVCFNAHLFEAPPGSIIFNLEDVMVPALDGSFVVEDPTALWADHEVWDGFESTSAKYDSRFVPVGHHPSMERFAPASCKDIDVFFCGVMNPRRKAVLDGLTARGLHVVHFTRCYGRRRDDLLSRSKLSLQMQYNPHGEWNTLRTAHCVANGVPILSEAHPTAWGFLGQVPYERLVDVAEEIVRGPPDLRAAAAAHALEEFRKMPLVLPS